MGILHFEEAVRTGSHVLVFLYGHSGSGKTYSSLLIARGLAGPSGKVVGIDTETGRMNVYAGDPQIGKFHVAQLTPPFSPARYVEAIEEAEAFGADVLVIDSLSHEWAGVGGVLDMADKINAKGLLKWAAPKAAHKRFVKKLVQTPIHIVACMRGKDKYKQVEVDGKKEVFYEGVTQEQDPRLIFEATVQLYMPMEEPRGVPVLEKCPHSLRHAFPEKTQISVATGKAIADWVGGAAPAAPGDRLFQMAEEWAAQGTEHLKAMWTTLKPDQQRLLAPYKDNLKSIAAAADSAPAQKDDAA